MDRPADDVELRHGVHHVLRAGVWGSGALLAVGLLLRLAHSGASRPCLRAGVVVLMCTPLTRVAALAIGYARRRDWPFFWVSFGVLAMLGVGMLLGATH
jgi:uncharacterized membrane protein